MEPQNVWESAGRPAPTSEQLTTTVEGESTRQCVATEVGNDTAVTAAHCVSGSPQLNRYSLMPSTAKVQSAVTYPGFDVTYGSADFAIIHVKKAESSFSTTPIATSVDGPLVLQIFREGAWIRTPIAVAEPQTCQLDEHVADLCVTAPSGDGICQGDSGAPILDHTGRIVAVVSHATQQEFADCGHGPIVAARLGPGAEWIAEQGTRQHPGSQIPWDAGLAIVVTAAAVIAVAVRRARRGRSSRSGSNVVGGTATEACG